MGNSTPPPPTRIRTPPTPLHGPKYDAYEPYSPRRSSRLNAKRDQSPLLGGKTVSPKSSKAKLSHHVSPKEENPKTNKHSTPGRRPAIKRTSSQHISPPSSPLSPSQAPSSIRRNPQSGPRVDMSLSSEPRRNKSSLETDSDQDISDPPVGHNNFNYQNKQTRQAMLPTPLKTPRKRQLADDQRLKSTARVLFPHLPATIDEAMPSPRKSRKARHLDSTLDTLSGDNANADGAIQIYTDSKERVPEKDDNDDNPFVSRRSARASKPAQDAKKKIMHGMTKEIDDAVERGEGIVYVFRGKKIFRRFEDTDHASNEAVLDRLEEKDSIGDSLRSEAAREATHRPLPRSRLQPRLLFPPKTSTPDPDDLDEEAVTDIETQQETETDHIITTTPVKKSFQPATPPTTVQKPKRPADSQLTSGLETDWLDNEDHQMGLDGATDYLQPPPKSRTKPQKSTAFDSWQRTKSGIPNKASSSPDTPIPAKISSTKRSAGEILEKGGNVGKRSRSGQV